MNPRRSFFHSAAAAATACLWLRPATAYAQGVSNIVELGGEVLVNGRRLAPDGALQPGDRIQTGPGSTLGFTIGRDAFLVRPASDLTITRGASLFIAGGARLVAGGLLAVFGPSARSRAVQTPTLTAGIRGTGFYAEARGAATYFCTCFGVIDLTAASGESETVTSTRHQARLVSTAPSRAILPAGFENHDDAELQRMAFLVGQRPAGYAR